MISGLLQIISDNLTGKYLDQRYGLVVPQVKHEKEGQRKVVPVCHTTNKLVHPDDKKMSVLWFEKDGKLDVKDFKEYMAFSTMVKAVLWINKDRINQGDPFIDDKVIKKFTDELKDYRLKNYQGYSIEKIQLVQVSTDASHVFAKYTLSEMVNFTHHPYTVCSIDFRLDFTYCYTDELTYNPKC